MPAKREQTLWPSVWKTAEKLGASFSLIGICSAGIALFDTLSSDDQKELIARVRAGSLPGPKLMQEKGLLPEEVAIGDVEEVVRDLVANVPEQFRQELPRLIDEAVSASGRPGIPVRLRKGTRSRSEKSRVGGVP